MPTASRLRQVRPLLVVAALAFAALLVPMSIPDPTSAGCWLASQLLDHLVAGGSFLIGQFNDIFLDTHGDFPVGLGST